MVKKDAESNTSKRIVAFDLIRGYFLFVILIDHLGRFFGFWEIFTGRGAQWVSAAEGFFFVSGIMLGMVRGRKMLEQPLKKVAAKVWRRSALLYCWAIGLSLAFSWVAHNFSTLDGLKGGVYSLGGVADLVRDTMTLNFLYGWGDFLGYYSVYLAFTPLAIWLIRKKLWPVLAGISLVVWMLTTTIMGSWQILFFSGLIVGFYYQEILNWIKSLKVLTKKWWQALIYLVSAVSLILSIFYTTLSEELGKKSENFMLLGINLTSAREYAVDVLHPYFDKPSLAIGSLVLFYIWFGALFLLINKYEQRLKNTVGRILIPFGQNSLYVYIMHAIMLFFMDLTIPDLTIWPINILINTGFVLTIFYMVKKKILFKIVPR